MKIAFFSAKKYDIETFKKVNEKYGHEIDFLEDSLNSRTALLAQDRDAVCVFVNDKINSTALLALQKHGVKLVALRCAGFNNVNLEIAKRENFRIIRVPAYSPQAVAEHAVALLLTLNRKIHKAYNRVRDNNFSLVNLTGFDVHDKTVGVIGTGQIGKAFAKIMLGFGCKVLAQDVCPTAELTDLGVTYLPLDDLLPQCDIISLHCPLLPETHHLISRNTLQKMKKGAMLINTSRGPLLNTSDVIESLKNKHLGYLAIDVYEQEQGLFFNDLSEDIIEDDTLSRLLTFPNVIVTGHQGFFTHEALQQIADTTLRSLSILENNRELDSKYIVV